MIKMFPRSAGLTRLAVTPEGGAAIGIVASTAGGTLASASAADIAAEGKAVGSVELAGGMRTGIARTFKRDKSQSKSKCISCTACEQEKEQKQEGGGEVVYTYPQPRRINASPDKVVIR